VTEIPLPPGHRREVWRYRPTGEEFAVQVDEATGRLQLAIERTGGREASAAECSASKTGKLLPPWLDEPHADCDVLRYETRLGVITPVAGADVTVSLEEGIEMKVPVSEIAQLDPARVNIGIPIVAVYVEDRAPAFARDTRSPDERFRYPRKTVRD
jgi:hypothetical protein